MSDFESFLEAERTAVNAALGRVVDGMLLAAPEAVAAPIRYALDAGGKRLRPILCATSYHAAGGRGGAAVYELAASLELIHTYSLVHDDLPCMDDDDLRRGRATAHRRYDERRAVLAGAAMIPLAVRAVLLGGRVLGLGEVDRVTLVVVLCGAAGAKGMVGGQLLDLAAEGRGEGVALGQLEAIHRAKTGALLAVSARIGGMAAGAPAEVVEALAAYGHALGLAFQVADDVLDVTGSPTELGKAAGRDEALGKATFPALLGIEGARRRAEAEAERAVAALRQAGVGDVRLEALARYAARRSR